MGEYSVVLWTLKKIMEYVTFWPLNERTNGVHVSHVCESLRMNYICVSINL